MAEVAYVARHCVQRRAQGRFRLLFPDQRHYWIVRPSHRKPARLARSPLRHDLDVRLLSLRRLEVVRRHEDVGCRPSDMTARVHGRRRLRFQPFKGDPFVCRVRPARPTPTPAPRTRDPAAAASPARRSLAPRAARHTPVRYSISRTRPISPRHPLRRPRLPEPTRGCA